MKLYEVKFLQQAREFRQKADTKGYKSVSE